MGGLRHLNRDAWDRWLWAAIGVGLVLRLVALVVWGLDDECLRDECIYSHLAERIVRGEGLRPWRAWGSAYLTAPGYPYLLATSLVLFGSFHPFVLLQLGLSCASIGLIYGIGLRAFEDRSVARIAAWGVALHPTLAFFAAMRWTETLYAFLLQALVLGVLWTRDDDAPPLVGVVPGLVLGACVLLRGVATYLAPIVVLALLWPFDEVRSRLRPVLLLLFTAFLIVAPYSIATSWRHGEFVITDTTIGEVIYLSNNRFEPVNYDYGVGIISRVRSARTLRRGRPRCKHGVLHPIWSARCEVRAAAAHIRAHPDQFLARVPWRMAQLLNPHSFFTRHLRWGLWPGLPWWAEELLVVWIAANTVAVVVLGTIGAWIHARGRVGVLLLGTVLYHVLIICLTFGMTRFRLPLEPLWIIYLAAVLADPRGTLALARVAPARTAGALLTVPVLLALMAWLLPTGFPGAW